LSLENSRIPWAAAYRLKPGCRYGTCEDGNLSQALAELDRIADQLLIPRVVQEEAAHIYRGALKRGLVRGRTIVNIAAASLYAACRASGRQRTLKEIASVSRCKKKDIALCYRLLLLELGLKMPIPNPRTFVARIASKANLPEKTQNTAIQLLDRAEKIKATTGKVPTGIAAAALYIACIFTGVKRTQRDIADSSDVTEVTVRNRYKALKGSLRLDI
jgi:transcription initiation factor TFIIB